MNKKNSISGLRKICRKHSFPNLYLTAGVRLCFCQGTASGALSGTVSDVKGDVIKGATVNGHKQGQPGVERTATTNDDGEYRLDLLPAGRYAVKVSSSGFGEVTSDNVELLVGQTNRLNFTMNSRSSDSKRHSN